MPSWLIRLRISSRSDMLFVLLFVSYWTILPTERPDRKRAGLVQHA